jgi:hypothetical protein
MSQAAVGTIASALDQLALARDLAVAEDNGVAGLVEYGVLGSAGGHH